MTSTKGLAAFGLLLTGAGLTFAGLGRPTSLVTVLVVVGAGCFALSILVGRTSEGSVEAKGTGVKFSWKHDVARSVGDVIEAEVATLQRESPGPEETGFALRRYSQVHYADVNNDGEAELLVEHPVGAHGRVLKVFGWIEEPVLPEFGLLAQLSCGLGGPFSIGDLDNDGSIEVAIVEVDWSKEGAYTAGGPYVEILYDWADDEGFVEVERHEIGSPRDFSGVDFKWYRWEGPVQ